MPNITPPDPGNALHLAKTCSLDAKLGAFIRARDISGEDEVRWLYPEAGAWVATCTPERRVSARTYAILREGEPSRLRPGLIFVDDGAAGAHYALCDDGFEAVAVPA